MAAILKWALKKSAHNVAPLNIIHLILGKSYLT